jgi:hypothetical protein
MDDANRRGISREWLAARIVIGVGFVAAIAVAAYFTLRPAQPPAEQPPAPVVQQQLTPAQEKDRNAKDAMMVCAQELLNAKNSGIIPSYGQLASPFPRTTKVHGRYACLAATHATAYVIAADLVCRNLLDSRCVTLYSVATSDGTMLYHRQH